MPVAWCAERSELEKYLSICKNTDRTGPGLFEFGLVRSKPFSWCYLCK